MGKSVTLGELKKELKQALKPMATKNELERLATKKDLERLATKKDLEGLATKQELEALAATMATKKDLEGLATKKELEGLATKKELEGLATKKEFGELRVELHKSIEMVMTYMDARFTQQSVELARHVQAVLEEVRTMIRAVDDKYADLPGRVSRLEEDRGY
jgi:protein required for attachment to host cells